jgi:hypothetical protein
VDERGVLLDVNGALAREREGAERVRCGGDRMTALSKDLHEYLIDYNYDRAHTGRLTQGRVPAYIVFGARKTSPGR